MYREMDTTNVNATVKHQALNTLENDVRHLKDSMDILQALIYEQQESIDTIEDAIRKTKEEVNIGQVSLVKAETHRTGYMYYLYGIPLVILWGISFILKK